MLFSVIIPVFNREGYIGRAIDSILSQDFSDFEVIVVDDGSTDRTPDVLRSYGDRVQGIRQDNEGAEVARRRGALRAQADYLVFLDSDDLLLPGALAAYDLVIRKCASPGLILGSMVYFNDTRRAKWSSHDRRNCVEVVRYKDFLAKDIGLGMSFSKIVIRKIVFEHAEALRDKGPSVFPMDDHDLVLRAGTFGPCVFVIQPATAAYRVHSGNAVWNLQAMVEATLSLIRAERRGQYPGGRSRRFSRYAYLGGKVRFWIWKALKAGRAKLALKLFLSGGVMVAAAAIKMIWWKFRGTSPSHYLFD